jgi:hypothetical protein
LQPPIGTGSKAGLYQVRQDPLDLVRQDDFLAGLKEFLDRCGSVDDQEVTRLAGLAWSATSRSVNPFFSLLNDRLCSCQWPRKELDGSGDLVGLAEAAQRFCARVSISFATALVKGWPTLRRQQAVSVGKPMGLSSGETLTILQRAVADFRPPTYPGCR